MVASVIVAPLLLLCRRRWFRSFVQSPRGRDAAVFAVLSAISATGLVLVMGLANQISLGQGAFMLIGGYAAAILTVTHGWNLLPRSAVSAVVIAGVGALVMGALTLRLIGFNLAIATLGIHLILLVFVIQWDFTGKHARRHRYPTVPSCSVSTCSPRSASTTSASSVSPCCLWI